jgi:aminoglycoside phosphotransferase (APT) family kinase protein
MTEALEPCGDIEAAADWLCANIADFPAPLRFQRIQGGHSNITVRVTAANDRAVALRRPPYGVLPRGAHDVVREARTVAALASSGIPVPDVLGVCTDEGVIGACFSVTAWVDGTVAGTPGAVDAVLPTAADRRRVTEELVATLARLHLAHPEIIGPLRAGPPYIERQLTRMMETRVAGEPSTASRRPCQAAQRCPSG